MAGFGLRIAKSQGMEGFTGNSQQFPLDPAYADKIFVGDPVILNGGNVESVANAAGPVTAAPILGVFSGWEETSPVAAYGSDSNGFNRYWTGASGAKAPVATVILPPHSLFWIAGDAGQAWDATLVGGRLGLQYAAGSDQFGDSRVTAITQAGGPLQLHRLVTQPGNAWGNANPLLEVSVVLHQGTAADAA